MDAKNKMPGEPLVAIVDDDASVRRSTRRLLRCCGLRAEAFASAEEFLQSGRVAETACLLLDVRMLPPIIFLSARASEDEERRALRAGAANFLRKPVSKEALLHAIRAVLKIPVNYQC